ncbi:MAG: DUF1987 domain-containing protein [Salinivirgaceae bacterium]|jgi:hypothetical protein|nr:DUF1987 domain-containing protein [Salinivirgaceae bacterium]
MKEPFIIEKTKKTPYVFFDPKSGQLEISGYSLPTNSQLFYEPLFEVVEKYLENPKPSTELVFNVEYFNTSSSKIILLLLARFETLLAMGKQVSFTWHIDEDDVDMYEAGKTYQASVTIPTHIVAKDSD